MIKINDSIYAISSIFILFLFIPNDITFCDNQSLNNSISDNVRVENNVK